MHGTLPETTFDLLFHYRMFDDDKNNLKKENTRTNTHPAKPHVVKTNKRRNQIYLLQIGVSSLVFSFHNTMLQSNVSTGRDELMNVFLLKNKCTLNVQCL